MAPDETERSRLKRQAAERAVEFVGSGMILGLGHGSTAVFAVYRIAELLAAGKLERIRAVPCSRQVEGTARELSIPLTTLDDHPLIDVTIDGADEVDPRLELIKGGGGALLREKIVAQASRREIIVVDETKLSPVLGTHRALPVEVIPFGWQTQAAFLEGLGAEVNRRMEEGGEPFRTDAGHYILDCAFGPIQDPAGLAGRLEARSGIVEHGLFLGLASDLMVATRRGIQHLTREVT
jgi:ribose 5-phosphate isomerase A